MKFELPVCNAGRVVAPVDPLADGLLWPLYITELWRATASLGFSVFILPSMVGYARWLAWRLWRLLREGRYAAALLLAVLAAYAPWPLGVLAAATGHEVVGHVIAGAGVAGETYMLVGVALAEALGLPSRLRLQRRDPGERLGATLALGTPGALAEAAAALATVIAAGLVASAAEGRLDASSAAVWLPVILLLGAGGAVVAAANSVAYDG